MTKREIILIYKKLKGKEEPYHYDTALHQTYITMIEFNHSHIKGFKRKRNDTQKACRLIFLFYIMVQSSKNFEKSE